MSDTRSIAGLLRSWFILTLHRHRASIIHAVPPDVHLDHIFIHLCIEDIMSLRRVNRAFFLLTQEPVIWKRFLELMNVPVPLPLRDRYSIRHFNFQFERLVKQAISVDYNWTKRRPVIFGRRIAAAHNRVLEMKLVPGGKYLVASVKDLLNYRFYIMVFVLDHLSQGPHAIARTPTVGRASNLQAKYLTYDNRLGVMIVYTRKLLKNGALYDPDVEVDVSNPISHEIVCLHMPLDTLELLSDPEIQSGSKEFKELIKDRPAPFIEVAEDMNDLPIHEITLAGIGFQGAPSLIIVQQPNEIKVVDLDNKKSATLVCNYVETYEGKPHRVDVARFLPDQKDILVVRTIVLGDLEEVYFVELYEIPLIPGRIRCDPVQRSQVYTMFPNQLIENIQISEYDRPVMPVGITQRPPVVPPPPISIFFRAINTIAMFHFAIFPETVLDETGRRYNLGNMVPQSVHHSMFRAKVMNVVPGVYRSTMYAVSPEDTYAIAFSRKPALPDRPFPALSLFPEWNQHEISPPPPQPEIQKHHAKNTPSLSDNLDEKFSFSLSLHEDEDFDDLDEAPRSNSNAEKEDDSDDEEMPLKEEQGPSIVEFRRYVHPEVKPAGYRGASLHRFHQLVTRRKRPARPSRAYAPLRHPDIVKILNDNGGLGAIAFDEIIARVCVIAKQENDIFILDYSQPLERHAYIRRGEMISTILGEAYASFVAEMERVGFFRDGLYGIKYM